MKLTPGTRFRLALNEELRLWLNAEGWAGCLRGVVEEVEETRVMVRFLDGQPWQFARIDFEAAHVADDGPSVR